MSAGDDGNEVEEEWSYAKAALNTTLEMRNLKVVDIYTTTKEGNSKGAMTLTCQYTDENNVTYTVEVRTSVLYFENGDKVTESYFKNKTIDVKGLVDYYDGNYQIALISLDDVVIK